jgi:predicted extracellular nuclease
MEGAPTPPAAPPTARSFGVFLGEIEDGRLHGDLTDALRDLVASLHEAQGRAGKSSGSLTINLAFKMDDGIIEVVADYKAKAPKLARGRTIFWATPDNNLTKRNPAQPDLPFRDVSVPRAASTLA